MKVIIELSPTSYIELFDKCPVRSISYNVIADGYFIRRRGSSRLSVRSGVGPCYVSIAAGFSFQKNVFSSLSGSLLVPKSPL